MSGEQSFIEHYEACDVERWVQEPPKTRSRTPFERDRARLIHSSALRRLGAKSQVLVVGTDDFVRTRLTHTLEVAQIGRQIASMLGANPDVVDCACLAHDLGHPPFGHTGEAALAALANNIGGFEANAQTLRLLTRLEPKIIAKDGTSAGLNLTRAALDASVKYPWLLDDAQKAHPQDHAWKFCVYPDDVDVFAWLKKGGRERVKPIECQIMDLSDDIAYSVHDLEDGIVIGAIALDQVHESTVIDQLIDDIHQWYGEQWSDDRLIRAYERMLTFLPQAYDGTRRGLVQLKNMTSTLIGRFASAVERATREVYGHGPLVRYEANVVIPPETAYEIIVLKGLAVHFVMKPRNQSQIHQRERDIVSDLVEVLLERGCEPHPYLEAVFREDWQACASDDERLRVAIDQVACLTDISATNWHRALCVNRES